MNHNTDTLNYSRRSQKKKKKNETFNFKYLFLVYKKNTQKNKKSRKFLNLKSFFFVYFVYISTRLEYYDKKKENC